MKLKLAAFVLACSVGAFAQHGGGHAGGPPAGAGNSGAGMGAGAANNSGAGVGVGHTTGATAGHPDVGHANNHPDTGAQRPLNDSQINGGAFRMLESRTGMTSDQLKSLYASSGAKNFGQFAAAIVVSKNLNLDTNKVLTGMKTMSLGETLVSLGVPKDQAKDEVKKAEKEVKKTS